MSSYLSPKLEARAAPHKGGMGVFACEPLQAGELLVVWGGDIFTYAQLMALPAEKRRHSVQVDEGLYQIGRLSNADYVNHSCDPNAGIMGQISIVAMRDIAPGEEICFDYAMCDGSVYDEFPCGCGAPHCRGHVTGNDWQIPELQARYAGYFSAYLERRIQRLAVNP